MSFLDSFVEDDRKLLISLPYRTGLWVSVSDESGGDEADEIEKRALETIVRSFIEDFCKSEFVEEMMRQTMDNREMWEQWEENIETVPEDCRNAIKIMADKLEHKHVTSFKHSLLDIAHAVAMAHREIEDEPGAFDDVKFYARYYWSIFVSRIKKTQPPTISELQNISKSEQTAIETLEKALRVGIEDGQPAKVTQVA